MAELKLYVFDDAVARGWQPFALTRPIGELLLGAYTFRERAERLLRVRCAGLITSDHLRGFEEQDAAPVVQLSDIGVDAPRIFLSSRAVVAWNALKTPPAGAALLGAGTHVIGCSLPAGAANPDPGWIERPRDDGSPMVEVDARVLERVWDLIAENPEQITRDHEARTGERRQAPPAGCETIAYIDGMLEAGADVTIEPHVVLDFSHGPIRLDDGVTIRTFTRLAGPAYVGRGSTLLGGPYEAVSIGPVCR
ncbi:MAG: putative sugar nucleotidyl transferase, partial [Longimicrobiales bacterium]